MRKTLKQILCYILLAFLLMSCKTYNVTCEWQHNSPSTVKGFKIYCGKYSRQYTYCLDLGMVSPVQIINGVGRYSITQAISDRTFRQYKYCAMTAYSETGESGYSPEVPWTAVSGLNFNSVPQIN